MEGGTSADYLREKLARSHEDLTEARDLLEQGKYRFSVNRAYYAAFHIVSATLAMMGHDRSKHSGVESAFHQYLIKPGLIEMEHGTTYKLARKWREDADYAIGATFSEETAGDILEQCEQLVHRLEQFLHERGWLENEDNSTT
ncbi:MAG: HEPN domain-containing protein [Anaerolineae bacterium]